MHKDQKCCQLSKERDTEVGVCGDGQKQRERERERKEWLRDAEYCSDCGQWNCGCEA